MVLGIIADLLASVTTIILPAYLSYKALRTSDTAQTTPWLIYFVILSLALLFESWTLFIIGWIPFYSWFRLIFLLYLVLPQTQGAKLLYLNYVEPFIVQHEKEIDVFIGETHQRLEQMGLGYMNVIVDWLRERVLGQARPGPPAAASVSVGGYAQNLLNRFAMPSAGTGATGAASNVYGMLSGVAGAAMGGMASRSRDVSDASPSSKESLIPLHMENASTETKSQYLAQQRERLSSVLRALDREQQSLDLAYGGSTDGKEQRAPHSRPSSSGSNLGGHHSGLTSKSKSEVSFEQVFHDDASQFLPQSQAPLLQPTTTKANSSSRRTTSTGGGGGASWVPAGVTSWFGGGSAASTPDERPVSKGWSAAMEVTEAVQGMSSSIDTGR